MNNDEATNGGSWYSSLNEEEREDMVVRVAAQLEGQDGANIPRRDLLKAAGVGMAGLSLGAGAVASEKINADDFMHRASAQSAAAGQVGTASEPVDVFASAVDTDELSVANNNTGFSGRLSDRPMVTTGETILTVGTDTSTIQEALNQIPLLIRHNFEIQVPDGTYNESLLVPPFAVSDSAGLNRDDVTNEGASHLPRITGNITTPTNVKVDSITVTGTQGAIAPLIEGFNVVGQEPYADEGAAVAIYGCQNVSFRWMSFAGGTARVGFLPYASGVTIRQECDLGSNVVKYGVETKHNANVTLDHFDTATYSLTGSATDYAVYNNDGCVVTLKDMQATGGIKDVFNREGLMYNANIQEYEPAIGARMESTVADQSISSATSTRVAFDTTEWDRKSNFDATNNKFVVPEAGRYSVKVQIQWLGPSDTTEMQVSVGEVSGAGTETLATSRLNGTVHTNPTQSVEAEVGLNENDEVAFNVYHDEGVSLSINTDNNPLTYATISRLT